MVFLNPTILLGLLAASIPVILHFLNLRKIKKVEFSTLAFLKELQKSKIRKIKIKQLLLLLLRILIIIFIVLSFARPTLETTSIGGISSSTKTTAVIIIDNSFSMSLLDEKGSFLNQSKAIVKDLLPSFQSSDDVHIILSSDKKLESFQTTQNIDAINISYTTIPLSKSLAVASELIGASNNLNKEVYIFSDFQKSTLFETDSVKERLNFANTLFYLFHYDSKVTNNLSVTNIKMNNQIFELNKAVSTIAEITNFSDTNFETGLSSLYYSEKRVAQKSISVKSKSTKNSIFQATIDKTGIVKIIAKLEDDELKYDNIFYDYIFVPEEIDILLVGKYEKEFMFVKSALKSNSGITINFNYLNFNDFNNTNLEKYKTIIISGSNGDSFAHTIKEYVSNGGNIILFPSVEYNKVEENKLLRTLNIPIATNLLIDNNNVSINSFEKIDFTHPIFNDIFNAENREIDSPEFYKFLKFSSRSNGKTIIAQSDNSSFLSEFNLEQGKILFFNTALSLEWSNFTLKNIFAPLINRSVSYLASNYSKEKNILAGDILSVNISKRKSDQIKVVRPDGSEELINLTSNQKKYFNYNNSNLVGIYKFYSSNVLIDVKAVNFNSIESNLESLPIEQFSSKLGNGSNTIIEISSSDDFNSKIATARYGSELWQLFLVIALMLALLEMYIAKNSKKDLAEI